MRSIRSLVMFGVALAFLGASPVAARAAETDVVVVSDAELPSGYEADSGSPATLTGTPATYLTVADCVVENGTHFEKGEDPERHLLAFRNDATDGSGSETVAVFATEGDAKGYYAAFAPYFAKAPKCSTTKTVSGSRNVPYGKFTKLDVGTVGTARAAMQFDSAVSSTRSYIAIVRTGASVAVVLLRGGGTTAKTFTHLVVSAAKHLAGSS